MDVEGYSFDLTEFRYKGSNVSAMKDVGENIHFEISSHFVITEFDITGVANLQLG